MTLVDADLRSGRRLETGRRSESIIYIYSFIPMSGCVGMGPSALLFPVACGAVKTILLLDEHILMMVDQFTKWVECIPLPSQSAEGTARAAVNQFFSRL